MSKYLIYISILLLLILSVPWFLSLKNSVLGFPAWAFFSFVITIIFAFWMAFIIKKYWDKLADNGDNE